MTTRSRARTYSFGGLLICAGGVWLYATVKDYRTEKNHRSHYESSRRKNICLRSRKLWTHMTLTRTEKNYNPQRFRGGAHAYIPIKFYTLKPTFFLRKSGHLFA
ncbi:hypothetical protein Cni_G00807 [Canna indica]|uniref:Uncharacterized protein n=1 Tax=Canna indica TaxID=4628 RepID=A0AAQ3JLX5_9LILI|nr:hypothetical protein Cni_G00807 [Canna indica]